MTERIIPKKIMKGIRFYNVSDLAKILNISELSARVYLRKNIIQGVKVGRKWYIREKNLNEFLLCKGIRDMPDDEMLKMINKAVQVRFNEWREQVMPIIDKKIVELFELYKKAFVNIEKVDKNNEKLEKVLPDKTMKHLRYRKTEIKKELEKV